MSDIKLLEQIKEYDKPHCYQYQKKLDTYEEDKQRLGWSDEDISKIKVSDFEFSIMTTKEEKKEASEFIKKYEWMGSLSQFNTHYFQARYKGELGCVIIMNMPNAFSKLLGEETPKLERLISRGASASWTPKNLASSFIMWCIKWMVNNTDYRVFTAYSDTTAKESGQIYRACNFYLLKQKAGTTVRCINPYNPSKIISNRTFRARSFYKLYCRDLGIEIQSNWFGDQSVHWENMPDDIEKKLREYSKEMYAKSKKIEFPPKLKWVYILGRNKRETKQLREKFLELNKVLDYKEAKKIREEFNK